MEIAFDDSWMEEIPGQEFARFGEYKDDQDVVARHLEEAEEAAGMARLSLEKVNENINHSETAVTAASVTTLREGLALCTLYASAGGEEALNSSSTSRGASVLVFDDDWMDEVPGQECARFGTYTDDRDVVAKHEQEETDAAALALLQKSPSETD